MKRLLKSTLAALALVATAALTTLSPVAAQGLSPGFPILGGGSYCGGYTNGVCSSTIPAGPSPSGTETIQTSTGLSAGRNPQTALTSAAALGTGAIQYETPLTGATVTVAANGVSGATTTTSKLIIAPAGTIAALTVNLPPATALVDGHRILISPTQIVTTLTMGAGSGNTFATTAPAALAVGTPITFFYRAADAKWYRGS